MGSHIYLVFTEPLAGEEEAFNEWYASHLDEVLEVEGFATAQRFKLAETDPPQEGARSYLVIYEIEGDLSDARSAFVASRDSRRLSASYDRSQTLKYFYTAVTDRRTTERPHSD